MGCFVLLIFDGVIMDGHPLHKSLCKISDAIHYDTVEDEQNKKLMFYSLNVKPSVMLR